MLRVKFAAVNMESIFASNEETQQRDLQWLEAHLDEWLEVASINTDVGVDNPWAVFVRTNEDYPIIIAVRTDAISTRYALAWDDKVLYNKEYYGGTS